MIDKASVENRSDKDIFDIYLLKLLCTLHSAPLVRELNLSIMHQFLHIEEKGHRCHQINSQNCCSRGHKIHFLKENFTLSAAFVKNTIYNGIRFGRLPTYEMLV